MGGWLVGWLVGRVMGAIVRGSKFANVEVRWVRWLVTSRLVDGDTLRRGGGGGGVARMALWLTSEGKFRLCRESRRW